jgi:hypothetical protein
MKSNQWILLTMVATASWMAATGCNTGSATTDPDTKANNRTFYLDVATTCMNECNSGNTAGCESCLVSACKAMATSDALKQQCEQVKISQTESQIAFVCLDECNSGDQAKCEACVIASCKQMCTDDACRQECGKIDISTPPTNGGGISFVCVDECNSGDQAKCQACVVGSCKQICTDDACRQGCDKIDISTPVNNGPTFVCVDECNSGDEAKCKTCVIASCKQVCTDDACRQGCDKIDVGTPINSGPTFVCVDECSSGDLAKCKACVVGSCKQMCTDDACRQECDKISTGP